MGVGLLFRNSGFGRQLQNSPQENTKEPKEPKTKILFVFFAFFCGKSGFLQSALGLRVLAPR
jgi:hypothetical protein